MQHVRRSSGTSTNYLAADHLGSVDAVLASGSSVLVRPIFSAFGARRDDDWNGLPSSAEQQQFANHTRRGFTHHEMLDNVGLVHMNGRVYDPAIGRFISADPFIDCAENPQGWNRYAYVKGRTLSSIDPTGFGMRPVISWINGIENVTVTASRIGFGFSLGSVIGGGNVEGLSMEGGARAGGRTNTPQKDSSDSEDDDDKKSGREECKSDCMYFLAPTVQALAGGAAGAVFGGLGTASPQGATLGFLLGFSASAVSSYLPEQLGPRTTGSFFVGMLAGAVEARIGGGSARGVVGGAVGEGVGGAIDGTRGATIGATTGGALAGALTNTPRLPAAAHGGAAGLAAGLTYQYALQGVTQAAEGLCNALCGP